MGQEVLTDQQEGDQNQAQDPGKRERSSIQFPYLPLEDAATIAKGVHAVGGTSCQVDQLAAHLDQKADTGSFRLKLGTAKLFGLTTHSMGTVTLTPLGARVCDPQQEVAAKVESFLNIPLYKQVYEQFKGTNLPPPGGLEAAMVTMGVAPKQKATARQVFQRSATFAGFFAYGAGRLVPPSVKGGTGGVPSMESTPPPIPEASTESPAIKNGGGGNGGGGSKHDALIDGLIDKLPPSDKPWPIEGRKKWLQTAAHILDLIYASADEGRTLKIEIQKDSE